MIDALLESCESAPVCRRCPLPSEPPFPNGKRLTDMSRTAHGGASTKSGCRRSLGLTTIDIFEDHLDAWLSLFCGLGHHRIHCAFKPFADGDCDRLSSLHGTSIMLPVQTETQAETPGRNRMSHSLMPPTVMSTVETVRYNFGMLRDDAVHWLARIQQPERLVVPHRCGDFHGPTWRSMAGR